jgi:thioesterase domain-containing protein
LPGYLVPSSVVVLEALPLTAHGKLDRKALPAPGVVLEAGDEAPPRDELEREIVRGFEETLDVRPLGRRADFFALGGHSLLATRLVARLTHATGRPLPLLLLFQNPTVEALAAALRAPPGPSSPAARALVPMQAGLASRRPLFFVHGGGGSTLGYAELASRLPGRPFYGLHAPALEGGELPEPSVEAIARRYLAEVREARPRGPYLLGGWSFGGLVALEMARQLHAIGEAVPLVVLVDTPAPGPRPAPAPSELGLLAAFAGALGVAWRSLSFDLARFERLDRRERLAYLLERAEGGGSGASGLTLDRIERLFDLFCRHAEAQRLYRPGPYDGPTLVVRAAERTPGQNDRPDLGWGDWVGGGVRNCEAPGDHDSIVRPPHVAELARALARELDALDPPDDP